MLDTQDEVQDFFLLLSPLN